jgi:polysaccharide biosynthesis transport protein
VSRTSSTPGLKFRGLEIGRPRSRRGPWSLFAIVAIATIAASAAVAISLARPTRYRSEARVLLGPTIADANTALSSDPTTERDLADSAVVAEMALDRLAAHGEERVGVDTLREGLIVDVVGDSRLLDLAYEHIDPHVAQQRAQAIAEAYLAFRLGEAQEHVDALIFSIRARADLLDRRIEHLEARINATSYPGNLGLLEAEIATTLGESLQADFELAALARTPQVGEIVQPATPAAPAGPNHVVAGGVGLLGGLALGFGYAGVRSRRDDRIASIGDLEAMLGAPVLGRVPSTGGPPRRARRIDASGTSRRAAEAYRIMRTNVVAAAEVRTARTILVTSGPSRRGSAVATVNLALMLASAGKRVVLVGADTRSKRLSVLLGVPTSPGLTDVLTGACPLAQAMVPLTAFGRRTNSFVLPAGTPREDPASVLGSEQMKQVLDAISGNGVELVLIDTPPVLTAAETTALARHADAVLLMVEARRATRASLEAVLRRLEQVGADTLGLILSGRWRSWMG